MPSEPAPQVRRDRPEPQAGAAPIDPAARRRNRIKLMAILAVCAAPVIASYFTYYVVKPDGRTNYGELLDPQRPVGDMATISAQGASGQLSQFRGKWVLLSTTEQGCDKSCENRLYVMRQVRLTTGKDRDRIERVLLVTGTDLPTAALLAEHEGLQVLRVDPAVLRAVMPQQAGAGGPTIFVVDPLGNLMMRFPSDTDPSRMKKDLAKLLRASRVG